MFFGKRLSRMAWAPLVALLLAPAVRASDLNMPVGVTSISRDVYNLHMTAFWVCTAIGVVVFGIMIYSLIAHRRSVHPNPAHFHESTAVEIAWTIAPFLILIAMAVPATRTLIAMYDTRNADMSVKITGYQWRWQYDYLDSGVSFVSSLSADSDAARQLHSGIDPATVPNYLLSVDHNLVLPVGKKVRLLITSNDVIHGWWVPDLAVKRDAIPGFINDVWTQIDKPGIYRGQCTVLCGRDHGFMPIVVEAVSPADFDTWVKNQGGKVAGDAAAPAAAPAAPAPAAAVADASTPAATTGGSSGGASGGAAAAPTSPEDLAKAGETVYKQNCAACHQATGAGLPPTFPSLVNSPMINGPAEVHIQQILKGKGAMPPFDRLSDAEVAEVATYERTAWGNHGTPIQPAQVTALRGH